MYAYVYIYIYIHIYIIYIYPVFIFKHDSTFLFSILFVYIRMEGLTVFFHVFF